MKVCSGALYVITNECVVVTSAFNVIGFQVPCFLDAL